MRAIHLGPIAASAQNDPLAGLLALRLEGDQITNVLDGADANSWPDLGAGGTNAFVGGTQHAPKWNAADSTFNGKPSVSFEADGSGMKTECSLTGQYTIVLVAAAKVGSAQRTIQSRDGSTNYLMGINRSGYAVYTDGVRNKDDLSANGHTAHILSLVRDASSCHVFLDGVDVTEDTTLGGEMGRLNLGFSDDGPFVENARSTIAAVGAFRSADSATRQKVEAHWAAKYGIAIALTINLLFIGNSITYGGNVPMEDRFPNQLQSMLAGVSGRATFVNYDNEGVSGATTAQLSDPTVVTNQVRKYDNANVNSVHLLEDHNQRLSGSDAATCESLYAAYCAARREDYGPVFATVPLPATNTVDAEWSSLVALRRANWRNYADALIDYPADPRLADPADGNYFQDGTHPTAAGYAAMAEVAAAAIRKYFQV